MPKANNHQRRLATPNRPSASLRRSCQVWGKRRPAAWLAALGLQLGLLTGLSLGMPPAAWTGSTAHAQSITREPKLRYDQFMGGRSMLKAFAPLVADARQAVVSIRCDDRIKAYGTIVRADGHLITKASELSGQIECELPDGTRVPAEWVATDDTSDLALLKLITPQPLTPIAWASEELVSVGQWAITPSGLDDVPLAVGVVSVPNRRIDNRLYLGIRPRELPENGGLEVLQITPALGAAAAGMKAGDIITHINDRRVSNRDDITQSVVGLKDGESIHVRITRAGVTQEMDVALSALKDPDTRHLQGQTSDRDFGFDEVIQHDTVLHPRDCGGPLLNSQGQAIGINIARAGRVASYALPMRLVKPALDRLFAEANRPSKHEAAPANTQPSQNNNAIAKWSFGQAKPYLVKALGFQPQATSEQKNAPSENATDLGSVPVPAPAWSTPTTTVNEPTTAREEATNPGPTEIPSKGHRKANLGQLVR